MTEFPYGIVTVKDKIIGQIIPYYDGYISIEDFFRSYNVDDPCSYFIRMVEILKELYDNGIIYSDVHFGNFLINVETDDIKLIDFESFCVSFSASVNDYERMISNLQTTFAHFVSLLEFDIAKLQELKTLEEFIAILTSKDKKLYKK